MRWGPIRRLRDPMENERPTRLSTLLVAVGVAAVVAAAYFRAPSAEWNLALFAILLGFSAFSDVMSIETESHLKISGNFLALVLAMVLLGGTPAALIGLISILAGWVRFREGLHDLLVNALTFMTFPLVVGVAFHELIDATGITPSEPAFYVFVFAAFVAALAINFSMIGAYTYYLERSSFIEKVRTVLIPLLPSELAAA